MNKNILLLIENLNYNSYAADNCNKCYFPLESKNIINKLLDENIVSVDKLVSHFMYYTENKYVISTLLAFLEYLNSSNKYHSYYINHINEIVTCMSGKISSNMFLSLVFNTGYGLDILINKVIEHANGELALKTIKYIYDNYLDKEYSEKLNQLESIILEYFNINNISNLLIFYKRQFKGINDEIYNEKHELIKNSVINLKLPKGIINFVNNTHEDITKEMEDVILTYGNIYDVLDYLEINPNPYNIYKIKDILNNSLKLKDIQKIKSITKKIKNYLQKLNNIESLSVKDFVYAVNSNKEIDIQKYVQLFNNEYEEDVNNKRTLKKQK